MVAGGNGRGRAAGIAKIENVPQKRGKSVVVAAADTFRAGAIEQLEVHASRLGFKLIRHIAGADPAAVAFDAVEDAKARGRDVDLTATAGRQQTSTNLPDPLK